MASSKPKGKGAVAAARRKQKQPPWLWIGTAALVVVLAVAALATSGGSPDKESAAGLEENRPVTVSGTPLPRYEPGGGSDPAVGQTAPDVTGQSFDGSPVEIRNDGRGKLIVFVAHWCPHCQKEIPLLADWLDSNSLPGSVDLFTVSTGVSDNSPNYPPSAWLEEEGWMVKTLADSEDQEAADAFGLSAFPYFVAVDGSGKVVARTSGEISTGVFADLGRRAAGAQ